MCWAEDSVASLLARLNAGDLDPCSLSELPAYKSLLQRRAAAGAQSAGEVGPTRQEGGGDSSRSRELPQQNGQPVEDVGGGAGTQDPCWWWHQGFLVVVTAVVMGVVFHVFHHELYTLNGFSKYWLRWENIDLHAEQCTVDMPAAVQDIFRPPVDCTMCMDVMHIDRVDEITPMEFEEKYAYTGRPVVITDGQKNWSARETFSFDYFKNIYGEDSPVLANWERDCQFFPYQTEFKNLGQVFNMSEDRASMKAEPWYIGWSNCDSSAANLIRQHYSRPYFLPEEAETSKTDWIFMGTPGYGAHLHIDHVGNPSWQAQIRGQKVWTLEPPPECYLECTPMQVTMRPGDIIVLDTNIWLHKTLIVSEEISITIGSEYD